MNSINGILMQYFHWYIPADGSLWKQVKKEIPRLAELGVSALWLPPAYKGDGGSKSVGYDTYDLYDLGEFDQKGSIRTKYGTKEEYLEAIESAHQKGIQIYADVVLNHKAGADEVERVQAIRLDSNNRNLSYGEPVWIDAWTKFNFPGRKGKYSDFTWNWQHFDGVDWAQNTKEKAIYLLLGRENKPEYMVDDELGNYDYLMFADLDFTMSVVNDELKKWGIWYVKHAGIDGFRLDAIKHIKFDYFKEWLDYVRKETKKELFTVGEYWNPYEVEVLLKYIEGSGERMSLFDAPLHHNFFTASRTSPYYDLRHIFDRSLILHRPNLAVTLVDNHDTQPLQALEAPVENWFKALAYSIILLREEGYPCIFYPDLYGASYKDKGKDGQEHQIELPPVPELEKLMKARKQFAWGKQHNYIDFPNVIGWTREGLEERPETGCAVLMSNSSNGWKWMYMGQHHAGKIFYDYLQHRPEKIKINANGWAEFKVNGGQVSVWIPE